MKDVHKLPLAIAISSAFLLSGCLGGSGSSSSSSSGTPGSPSDPAPGPGELFSYSVAVDLPDPVIAGSAPQSLAERLVNTALNTLISQAFAQVVDAGRNIQPDDISLRRFGSDGEDETLADTEVTPEEDGTFTVQSPQGPANDIYVQVNADNFSLRVPASQSNLVANPITTLITQQIANRLAQLEDLNLEEINALVESIEQLAEDDSVRGAIEMAVFNSANTEQLLNELNVQLSAVVNQALDDFTTPAADGTAASNSSGEFYVRGLSLGVFSDDAFGNGGGLLTGTLVGTLSADFSASQAQITVNADEELDIEFVHAFGVDNLTVLARSLSESESDTLPLDARGILVPEQSSFGDYDIENSTDSSDFYCLTQLNADCTDREYIASVRASAAGPANSPYATLATSFFDTREVRDRADNNRLIARVVGGGLEVLIKKPTSNATINGDYGIIEVSNVSFNGNPGEMELENYLLEASFDGNGEITFCEPLSRFVFASLDTVSPSFSQETADCSAPANQETVGYTLASNGELVLGSDEDDPLHGWLSDDGLTFLAGFEDPSLAEVLDADGSLELGSGETQTLIGVKRAGNIDLSGSNYRLIALGTNVESNQIGTHLISAGSLRFDGQGEPSISASLVLQNINDGGLAYSNNNFPLDLATLDSHLSDGKIELEGEYTVTTPPLGTFDFSASGYVQEDGRMIILSHLLETSGAQLSGVMLAVCTNCND